MWILLGSLLVTFPLIQAGRAGVTHCSGETFPGSYSAGGTSGGESDKAYMIEDKDFTYTCCGIVSHLNFNTDSAGDVTFQTWRQKDATEYELISLRTITAAAGDNSVDLNEDETLSFREGDLMGWYSTGQERITYTPGPVYGNRQAAKGSVDGLTINPASYSTYTWASQDAKVGRKYDIQAATTASTAPYFKNLPATLTFQQSDVLVSGVEITTLIPYDANPDDVGGLKVKMAEDWIDIFTFDSNTLKLTTASALVPDLSPYMPVFEVEEDHCGLSATATLTLSIVNSVLTIANLPAYADIHEDTLDLTLLHTLTLSDPENTAIWCKGDWTIGQEGTGIPFIVKMISTTAGSSSAGIYLIEWPKLDYGTKSKYDLTIKCYDTGNTEASGTFTVNIIENQKPIFVNLENSVEVDATKVRTGSTIFVISTTDAENDQVVLTHTCTPAGTCPITLFDSGHTMLTEELLFHTGASFYELEVTPSDHRASNTPRKLNVYIINISNAPVFTNVNGATVTVAENTAASSSLFQASATDADSGDVLEYSMTITPSVGWQLFTIDSASGIISTHANNSINYEVLNQAGSTSFSMVVMVHDGKQLTKETLAITVTDVNEPPKFTQPAFGVSATEGTSGTTLAGAANLPNSIIDPDDNSWSLSLDCGTYDSYFTMDSSTGVVTYSQDYDLDTTSLPTSHFCKVTAEDSAANTATAMFYISISYTNDHLPVFSPSSYTVTVGIDSVLGTSILKVTATDDDKGAHGNFEYSLDQSSLSGSYFAIGTTGVISVGTTIASALAGTTKTVPVTATDSGGQTDTANIVMTFSETAPTTTTTTESNRDITFAEDTRNIAWLTAAVITLVIALGVVVYMVIKCIIDRGGPLPSILTLNFKLPTLTLRPRIGHERDENNRTVPFGKQRPPVIRHIHSKDLRVAPIVSEEPDPETKRESKPTKTISKTPEKTSKVLISRSDVKDRVSISEKEDNISLESDSKNDLSWMDRKPSRSVAPTTIVTHVKATDKEYMNRTSAVRRTSPSAASNERVVSTDIIPPSPSMTISQASEPIRVTPSPLSWDNRENSDISLPDSLYGNTTKQK